MLFLFFLLFLFLKMPHKYNLFHKDITKKFHSPIFRTSLDALQYLRLITIKNNWNLIYKPHPIMCALKQSESKITKNIDIITDVDINSAIDFSDLVITILSQGAYISLIRNKPVLMLGYTQQIKYP